MSEMNPDKLVGAVIQNRRLEQGISQGELADRLRRAGVPWSQGTLSRVELGERPVRLVEAAILAEVLDTELLRLIEGEKSPEERAIEGHQDTIEAVKDLMGSIHRVYGTAHEVKDLLETAPHLWAALEEATQIPQPAKPSDYETWLAHVVSKMPVTWPGGRATEVNEFGAPYTVETRAMAESFMQIPQAVIASSIAYLDGRGDGNGIYKLPSGATLPTRR
ncbi:helix-turn-helix domain-containing protein [Paenarthrobacter sp. JL.01a]|uniref:helix-turn-helix domain-containing protein n=1 Tax=Paenarthrobacter sp. JL.01a TaxID=2979324 RepID=UPI0021C8F665|nr:helix-turn-helix transcriptional regulator [Paenarthrobacter sp. JL.01a]UXM93303.1 helix-turn-helix domain-containing protein [Paenarthrobacter sp. JL.01a]